MLKLTTRISLPLLTLALACNPDNLTAPKARAPSRMKADDAACQGQINPDPNCADASYTYYAVVDGDGELATITINDVDEPPPFTCPYAFHGVLAAGTLTGFGDPLPFVITGDFHLDSNWGGVRYVFPAGYWDAADGTGRQVQIGSGEATCSHQYDPATRTLKLKVVLGPHFYDVSVRVPNSGGGGGNSGGAGSDCTTEYITVQTNDGNGWQDWWSGWAEVCD